MLTLVDTEVPPPGAGEVTIDVRAAGVNPADHKNLAAGRGPDRPLPLPIGFEVAADGRLVVPVARTFPLSEAVAAIDLVRSGHPGGKVALTVTSA